MTDPATYVFEWDPAKARDNAEKHGVGFDLAATVFRDPLHVAVYDDDHSEDEDRRVTLGQAEDGSLIVVIHTFEERDAGPARIRIISSRAAARRERQDYEEGREAREPMRSEYDFSKGVRGRFHRPGVKLAIPVYLDPEVQAFVAERAAAEGTRLEAMVNTLLRAVAGPERQRSVVRRAPARKSGRRGAR
jgi:hypothetical protein